MAAPFFYHRRMLRYDFGPRHPLRPERLRRTIELLESLCPDLVIEDPGLATDEELRLVHTSEYLAAVAWQSANPVPNASFGFSSGDNPPFVGMDEAARAYSAGSMRAAERVAGGAPLAFNLAGGLHHAMPSKAAGFCVYNDVAMAAVRLAETFDSVLYIDIDVHHGDGVQEIAYGHPKVATFSIHESPLTLWPQTGALHEGDEKTFNLPVPAGTSGDVWREAFERSLALVVERVQPQAIVLQMGIDPHFADPLAHLQVAAQDWLGAVNAVRSLHLPTVATGGGGYNLTTVPRMWAGATLTLLGRPLDDERLIGVPEEWGFDSFADPNPPRGQNAREMQEITVAFGERVASLA